MKSTNLSDRLIQYINESILNTSLPYEKLEIEHEDRIKQMIQTYYTKRSMFTREEKNILLEAVRPKIARTLTDLENTNNEEIKAKKERRIEVLLSCKTKISCSNDVE